MFIVREPRRFIHVKRAGTTDPIGRKDIPWTSQKCFAGKVYPMLFPPNHHKCDVTTGKPFFKNGRNIIHGTIITKVLTHIFYAQLSNLIGIVWLPSKCATSSLTCFGNGRSVGDVDDDDMSRRRQQNATLLFVFCALFRLKLFQFL